ncbi:sensor histidine kinase [Rugosimonospora africana]|uniref:histidine kinase n=1 Tax=Rugosimonospora africana TaxID=556532 RepID=A0A8J3VSU7_9ACTN|nr:histidine kinase [Rugosimonospora africana]GIH16991.1 two-component sensor histidine kinase [Rugosimonospora africana]
MAGWTGWIRRGRRLPVLLDVLLWAALSLPAATALISPPWSAAANWRALFTLALLAVAVAASRRYPLASLVIVVTWTLQDGNAAFAIPVMSYLVGIRMRTARPAALGFAAIVVAGTVINVVVLDTSAVTWFVLTATLLFAGVLPWLVGRYLRQHRELERAGWERAEQLEREREFIAEQARLRERARIAQDMHDSLGHELSLIALRAGALEVSPDLEQRRRAASELRANTGAAIERLRDIIGVLRDGTEPAPLEPVHETVSDLVDRARRSGLAVRLRVNGDPARPAPMLDRAVYRVVQESLTNAAKHAPGAAVTVLVTHAAKELTVTVTNDPPPAGPLPAARRDGPDPGGTGLVGLTERVRLAGGTLHAGPYDGGFRLVARLPSEAAAGLADHAPSPDAAGPADPARSPDAAGLTGTGPGGWSPLPASGSARQRHAAQRRARRSLATALIAPVASAVVLGLGYYSFATFDSVLVAGDFARLRVGDQRADLASVLPARQAMDRPAYPEHPTPPGSACEFYTDGNFPFAQATYRLCFAGGRLVSKDDVRDWTQR